MSGSTLPKLTDEQRQLFIEWLQWRQQFLTEQSKYWRKQVDHELFADWHRSCREVEGMLRNEAYHQQLREDVAKVFGEEQEPTEKENP